MKYDDCPNVEGLLKFDISHELWREYDFIVGDQARTYKIQCPICLYTRSGGSTHRIIDNTGVSHLCPTVGEKGCVVRWKNPKDCSPCKF